MRLLLRMLIVSIMIVMVFTPFATANGARIWTDKDDYDPYETVTIFGEGFLPNRQITITIRAPDSSIDTVYAWSNGSGAFSAQYVLNGQSGTYVVIATDGTNVATTTFTDRKWFVSVSPNAATVPQGGSTTATVYVTADPPGGPEVDLWASGQPSGVTVSFSPSKGVSPFTSIMTINVGSTVPPGTCLIYIIVFTGVPGHPSFSEKARTNFTLTVTGAPPQTVSITVTSSPVTGAGFVKVDGSPIVTPATFVWDVGSNHTLEALSPVPGLTGTRYVWTSWSDGGAQTHTYTVPNVDQTVTAYYKTQYYLTVSSAYGTAGGEGWYDKDAVAYATVTPLTVPGPTGTRYVFTHWSGDASGNTSPSNPIIMNSPKTAIANWRTEYQLTVRTTGLGTYTTKVYNGTTMLGTATDATPYTGWFKEGSYILLDVESPLVDAAKRFVFTQWSGDAVGTSRPVSLTMNSPKDVTANYKTQYQITVTASPSGALGGTFKVTYTQCGTTYINVQKATPWTDWADAGTTVVVSEPQNIVNGYQFNRYDPSSNVSMTEARTITLVYVQVGALSVSISPSTARIKVGESVNFTSSVSGGKPPYSYQWYLNESAVSGATSPSWTFTPTATGYYIVYLKVTDAIPQTAKSNEASVTVAPQLTVSISLMSASIVVGQSVDFTSVVSGGYPPYSYQWFLNGAPVSGATSSSWKFIPTESGIYYVYLKVTDSNNNIVQSAAARVSVSPVPVGGYSVSLIKTTPAYQMVAYTMLITLFAALLSVAKRGRKFSKF